MSYELPPPPPGTTLMSPQEFLDRKAAPSETPRTQQLLNEVTFISRPGWQIEAPKKWLDRFIDHTCQLERGLAEAKRDLHAAGDGDTWRAAYHRANEALQKCQQDLALAQGLRADRAEEALRIARPEAAPSDARDPTDTEFDPPSLR